MFAKRLFSLCWRAHGVEKNVELKRLSWVSFVCFLWLGGINNVCKKFEIHEFGKNFKIIRCLLYVKSDPWSFGNRVLLWVTSEKLIWFFSIWLCWHLRLPYLMYLKLIHSTNLERFSPKIGWATLQNDWN